LKTSKQSKHVLAVVGVSNILTQSRQKIPPQHLIATSNANDAAVGIPNWICFNRAAVVHPKEVNAETARFQRRELTLLKAAL
jgi:hypothetical protein